jgi:hypothetical protein
MNINFNLHLAKAETTYQTLSLDVQENKEALVYNLSEAYKSLQTIKSNHEQISNDLKNKISRIFFLYGKSLYGGNMQDTRRMFELAFTAQLFSLNAFNKHVIPNLTENLQDLPKQFPADYSSSSHMHDFLMSTSDDNLVSIAQKEGKEHAFNIAATLRWAGATYQNIDSFCTKEHAPLFEKVYGVASKIWEDIALKGDESWKKDCHWEIVQIIYNTERFRHYLQNPNDVKGALEKLQKIEPYLAAEGNTLRAQQLRAQIHNIKGIDISKLITTDPQEKLENLKSSYESTAKAEEIAASTPEFNPFIRIMFLSNKATRALTCLKEGSPVADINEIRGWFNQVLTAIEKEKYNHYYHAFFLINAAKCEIHDQAWEKAHEILNKAEEIANMYPDSSAEANKATQELRLQIKSF